MFMQCSHRIASRFFMRVRLFSIVCLFSGCLVLYATQPGMSIFTDDAGNSLLIQIQTLKTGEIQKLALTYNSQERFEFCKNAYLELNRRIQEDALQGHSANIPTYIDMLMNCSYFSEFTELFQEQTIDIAYPLLIKHVVEKPVRMNILTCLKQKLLPLTLERYK